MYLCKYTYLLTMWNHKISYNIRFVTMWNICYTKCSHVIEGKRFLLSYCKKKVLCCFDITWKKYKSHALAMKTKAIRWRHQARASSGMRSIWIPLHTVITLAINNSMEIGTLQVKHYHMLYMRKQYLGFWSIKRDSWRWSPSIRLSC